MLPGAESGTGKENTVIKKIAALLSLLALGACGEPVEVPPAHVGKILTSKGFRQETLPPSKFRLDPCWTPGSLCDRLVLVEASDYAVREQLKIFMPRDQLNLTMDVRGVLAIQSDPKTTERIFDRVTAQPQDGYTSVIPMNRVYETYAAQTIRESVRSLVTQYSIDQIMENRDAVGQALLQMLQERLAGTPIQVLHFGLADVQPPDVIVRAKEVAKEREIAIQQAEAEKQIALKRAEAEIELAEKDKIIRLKKAEAILVENLKVAESVSEKYLAYRYLDVLEEAAKSNATVFFPLELTQSAGLQNRIFNSAKPGQPPAAGH